jgi:ribonuclease P protein component
MFKPFTFSQSEARDFLKNCKTLLRIPGLKLVTERKTTKTISDETAQTHQNAVKLLIVIPRRVGNACTRNLIRRRIKSAFYKLELEKSTPKQYALFVYPEVARLSYKEIENFLSILSLTKILKPCDF